MAQSLQIKKINSLPSTFEKGTVYFYPAQKQILLGLGSGSTEGTHYVVFKGTDTTSSTSSTISMTATATSAAYPMLFSRTASMTSGSAYGIGYDAATLTYNPSLNTLHIGNSSTATTSHGMIKFGGKDGDNCYIGTDSSNISLNLSGPEGITFYEGTAGTTFVHRDGSFYPSNGGELGISTYAWDDIYTKSMRVLSTGSIYFNGTSNYISGSSTTQLKLTGSSTINFTIGSTSEASISSSAFYPTTSAGLTLGSSTYYWGNTYLGNTYIGKTASGTITLGVNNTITGNYNSSSTSTSNYISITSPGGVRCSTGFYETSDERLKDFKGSIDVDFDKLKQIPKEYFVWKSDENKQLNIGTSAQKLKEIYPELVIENEDGSLTVSYNKLSIVALKAVDVLNNKCDELEKKNKELEERLCKLENLIKSM